MSHSRIATVLSLGCLLLLGATAVEASTITCESKGGAYRACSVDTRNGVRLSRQLSSQGCWQNDTWGYDRNRIWVDRGCRAEFQVGDHNSNSSSKNDAAAAAVVVGLAAAAIIASNKHDDHHDNYRNDRYDNSRYGYNGYGGDPRRTFSCESRSSRLTYCSVPTRGHVEVYKQRSSSPCTYGRSWGVDGNRVWVDDGCRAEFAVF
jgi:hypothetical protein